ncbi:hypothetical protein D3C75_1192200 [compost metagenome]
MVKLALRIACILSSMVALSASSLMAWDSAGRSNGEPALLTCADDSARMLLTISLSMLSRVAERTRNAATAMMTTNTPQVISQANLRDTSAFTSFTRASSCS